MPCALSSFVNRTVLLHLLLLSSLRDDDHNNNLVAVVRSFSVVAPLRGGRSARRFGSSWFDMSSSSEIDVTASVDETTIRNFRPAWGVPRVYRSGSTDALARRRDDDGGVADSTTTTTTKSRLTWDEEIVYGRVGLVVDLRSDEEIDHDRAATWTRRVVPPFSLDDDAPPPPPPPPRRRILRVDVLSPKRLFAYLEERWIASPATRALSVPFLKAFDVDRLHGLRMDVLNERGLAGLYEAIVETARSELREVLVAITEFWETRSDDDPYDAVLVHCVQGKDRTGIVVALMQSVLGASDDDLLDDYHLSDRAFSRTNREGSSAAAASARRTRGKLDRAVFSGAPREAMERTLSFVRTKYGSVCPGYLDAIGFDESWRKRFRDAAVGTSTPPPPATRSKL